MKVGSDIKMFDIRSFDTYINDGWKEGFNITWSGKTDKYYTNTLLNKTNYDHATNTLTSGNTYTDEDTFSGWKFLYKPYNSTKMQWVLLYTFVHAVDNGQGWFHYNCNLYDLVVDGKQMVSMPDTDTSQWTSSTAPTLNTSNGVGTQKSLTAQNGRTLNYGMLIHPVDQGTISAGTTQVVFYGTFTPTYTEGNANQTFKVKFRYTNWAYMAVLYGVKAIAKSPENWSTSQSWGDSGAKSEFKSGKFTNTQTASITGSVSVTTLASDYASYGQTVRVSGGNYVHLESSSWETGWNSSPQDVLIGNSNLLTAPRSGAIAKSSFWSDTNGGANWFAQKSFSLQYAPNVSNYQINSSSEDSVTVTFSKHTPAGKSGYFNAISVGKSGASNKCYIGHNVTSSQVTITVTRSQVEPAYVDVTTSVSGDIIQNSHLEVGLDAFTLNISCNYHNSQDGTNYANDLTGTVISFNFGSGFSITSFELMYPLDSAGITHAFAPAYEVDFCVKFTTTDISSVGYAYVSVGPRSQKYEMWDGENKVKLKGVQVSEGSETITLTITNASDPGTSNTPPTANIIASQSIPVSITTANYETTDFQNNKLVNLATYRDIVVPYLIETVQNYQTIYPEWNEIFQVVQQYVWDVNYLEILKDTLITTSLRTIVEKMVQFYQAVQDTEDANGYDNGIGDIEPVLKNDNLQNFVFDVVHTEYVSSQVVGDETWNRYDLVTDFYPELISGNRYRLIDQSVDFIDGDEFEITTGTSKDDLIEVKRDSQFGPNGSDFFILNLYQNAIMYMLNNVF